MAASDAPSRCFPVVYVDGAERSATFYERLGFVRHFQLPEEGEPGYVGLRRGDDELAVVDRAWPRDMLGLELGTPPRFELFAYVDDVDARVEELRGAGVPVLREPADMPWGERVGYVADPDGNPIALAAPAG
jgi:lactoylglutathione lyase